MPWTYNVNFHNVHNFLFHRLREEREWREWVDNKLVHVLPPNIYRTPSESLQAFDYISRVGNFNVFERAAAKYLGAFGMYFIAKLLKKKYQLDSDVRNSLYRYCNEWCKAVGKDRQFMGGKHPNLADLVSAVMVYTWYLHGISYMYCKIVTIGGVAILFEVWWC